MKTFRLLVILMGLLISTQALQAQVPELNQQIVKYVGTVIGTKVGRGECWDLAHDALEGAGASWDHAYGFGKEVFPSRDSIYPGDIVQFNNVVIKSDTPEGLLTETYGIHTAVVYEVLGPGKYRIAHQNTGFSGRKVGLSVLTLANKKSGKIRFYRPVKGN